MKITPENQSATNILIRGDYTRRDSRAIFPISMTPPWKKKKFLSFWKSEANEESSHASNGIKM